MMTDYNPQTHERFPHKRYSCECGNQAIVIGWEVETVICDDCDLAMTWAEDLHYPD